VNRLAALLLLAATACTSSKAVQDTGTPACEPIQTSGSACNPDDLNASMDCTWCDGGAGFVCVCSPGAAGEAEDGGGPAWVCVASGHACQ
jgi:hypothetical protein